MLPKRYTQGVMTGESEYLQTPRSGRWVFWALSTLSLGLEAGLRNPLGTWGRDAWLEAGRGSQTRNVAVTGMASLVCSPPGCEAQVGLECPGAPV